MILSVKDVQKSYGKEKIIKKISFEMKEPEIVALIGPNGSGKSTLLNVITNLIPLDNGKISIFNMSNKDPEIFRNISYMQDNSVLYDYLTGYDHLQFICDVQNLSKQQILNTAERVGMENYLLKKVSTYSLGMKQHLLLTMALVNQPKLLILDEPLNGLDPTSAIRVRKLLLELHQEGTAILLSSHQLAEIDRITSHILFLKNGKIIEEDISVNEQIYYISVDKLDLAKSTLEQGGIRVEIIDQKLVIYDYSSIGTIVRILNERDIKLFDIDKKILGSEERYQKIFRENGVLP